MMTQAEWKTYLKGEMLFELVIEQNEMNAELQWKTCDNKIHCVAKIHDRG